MSVKVMSAVFDRYPFGGGEMILALAIADFSHDDGTKIFPSVKTLAVKTRQSDRTVQRQLQKMETDNWLILVKNETGGRGITKEYKINPVWIAGGDIKKPNETSSEIKGDNMSPFDTEEKGDKLSPFDTKIKGDNLSPIYYKGCQMRYKRVTNEVLKGDTAMSPDPLDIEPLEEPLDLFGSQSSPQKPKNEISAHDKKTKSVAKSSSTEISTAIFDSLAIDPSLKAEFMQIRKSKRQVIKPTDRAMRKMLDDADRAGLTIEQALEYACDRGWASFQFDYWQNAESHNARSQRQQPKKLSVADLRKDDWISDDEIQRMISVPVPGQPNPFFS